MYKVLLTSIGKRVQLINHLKRNFEVIGIDANINNAALNFVDRFYRVPKYFEAKYIESILDICDREHVNILIPLYEREFKILLHSRDMIEKIGTKLLLSDEKIVNICNDKLNTYYFFIKYGILTANTYERYNKNDIIDSFPMIVKPIDGMGSQGVYKTKDYREMVFFKSYVKNSIIQQFIDGVEYTVDVLCDFCGNIISIVPRERLEVRAGEVSKSKTVKNNNIISKTQDVIEALKQEGNVIGPITVQCILNENGIYFIEINCRFGGGVPLTFEAGVDYSKYLIKMIENKRIDCKIGDFNEVTMLRYDEAVFIKGGIK